MSLLLGVVIGIVVFGVTGLGLAGAAGGIAAGLVAALLAYGTTPVLSVSFMGSWMLVIFSLVIGTIVAACGSSLGSGSERRDGPGRWMGGMLATIFVAVVFAVGGFVTTSAIFHAEAYASLLGEVPSVPFETAIQRLDLSGHPIASDAAVIDQTDVRLVDAVLAERRAQELLGQDPEFGGTYTLGAMQLTRRQGRLVWAAPLDFSGFSRWNSSSGSPAYVWVDAHDTKEAALVKEVDGKPIRMRCLESSWFGTNIERAVWEQGFQSTGLTDFSFELEDGRPMFVVTTYANEVGFGGANPTGIVVFDPQTCTSEHHSMADVPAWVNRVVPADMILEQVTDHGEYVHGWSNANFGAHADILHPTPGIELVSTTRNGATAWYMGLATSGNPNGTTGFLLVDSRTKKAVYFQQAGATEGGAQAAILGKIAEKRGWTATWPILYNIGGRPTYLATIKDQAGNFKGVGLTPVDDRNIVVVSDDLHRALQVYQQTLAGQSSGPGSVEGGTPEVTLDGRVVRFASEVIDGNTVYYLIVEGHPDVLLTATNRIGPQVALTGVGDAVRIRASGDVGSGTLTVQSLSNAGVVPVAAAPSAAPVSALPTTLPASQ